MFGLSKLTKWLQIKFINKNRKYKKMPHISEIIGKGYVEGVIPEALLELILKFIRLDAKDETKEFVMKKINNTKITIPYSRYYLSCKTIEFFCEEIEELIEEIKLPEFELNNNIIHIPKRLLDLFLNYFEKEEQKNVLKFLHDRLTTRTEHTSRLFSATIICIGDLIKDLDNMKIKDLFWLFDENGNSIFD